MEYSIEVPEPEKPKQDYPYMARGVRFYNDNLYFVISASQAVNLQNGNIFEPAEANLERLPDGAVIVVKSKKGG